MNIQPIETQSANRYTQNPVPDESALLKRENTLNRRSAQEHPPVKNSRTSFVGEYYSSEKLKINYTSKDGDSFSFDYEKIEYQRHEATIEAVGKNEDDKKQIIENINELYDQMKRTVVEELLKSFGYQIEKSEGSSETEKVEATNEIPGLPEYWNAENTSQRIFEFAISFASLSEQDVEGYYNMMREAIQDGYSSAMGEIGGTLTDKVSSLTQNTLELALEKLDNWAIEQGVDVAGMNSIDAVA